MADPLLDVIARVESAGDFGAMRFEERVYDGWRQSNNAGRIAILGLIKTENRCNTETAAMIAATSWGKFQMMGFNIYDPDGFAFDGPLLEYLTSEHFQEDCCSQFLRKKQVFWSLADVLANPVKQLALANAYNGPDNVTDYVAKLLAAAKELGVA